MKPSRRTGLVLALLLTGACGGRDPSPRWVSLARAFRPAPLLERARAWHAAAGLDPARCSQHPWNVHVVHTLQRSAWARAAEPDTWTAALPGGAFAYGSPDAVQLRAGAQSLALLEAGASLAVDACRLEHGRFTLRLAPGAEPPAELELTQRLDDGRLTSEGVWQVHTSDEFRDGIVLWSGAREELACTVPDASQLAFELRFSTHGEGRVTLRVRLDDAVVLETSADSAALGEGRRLRAELPERGRESARLAFELEGPPGRALLLEPVLGPAEHGSPGRRPFATAPDIVVLLADTFRADSLAYLGGASDWTPNLNALAERSLRFRNAHAAAAWTLPSIGSLLTGLTPAQHTANTSAAALPEELVTIAELLSRAGYRTGAVTDAAFFAPLFGLDQGFERFVLHQPERWDLERTVEDAQRFLEADDGRPVFLVVHSYRTHNPYRTGREEDVAAWNELLADGCVLIKSKGKIPREEWRQRLRTCRARYAALYRQGVRDLDRGFGEILAAVERRGMAASGYVVFTADHGEALGENDDIFHDGKLWETKLRVPLVVRGPGLAPRDVEPLVTLLDLAPTVAELAGVARDPRWSGASLLSVAEERAACAFLLKKETQVVLLEAGRKLYFRDVAALERGAIDEAYDLRADPGEEHPVRGETWPQELAQREAGLVRALATPVSAGVAVPLTAAQRAELGQLGYGGGEEEE